METSLLNSADTRRPYRLGVALSGGGARGFAHAGALMAIEEAGLKPDVIAGVSAGSVIAVLYAAGVKPLQMAQIFASSSVRDFVDLSFGHGGMLRMERFALFIIKALGGIKRIEDLKIPTFIGATDLEHAKPVFFDKGTIAPRLMASCSIPIVFRPVVIDGVSYVDGGVMRNHPAWIIRDKCDYLIGVNVSPLLGDEKSDSLIEVAIRTFNIMAKSNQREDMDMCDLSIVAPELSNYGVFSLKHIKKVFISGYANTKRALRDAGLWNPEQNSASSPLLKP